MIKQRVDKLSECDSHQVYLESSGTILGSAHSATLVFPPALYIFLSSRNLNSIPYVLGTK